MTHRSTILALAALCGSLLACGSGDAPLPPAAAAQPPLARLWLPRFGAPGDPLFFDASDSQSPGGAIAHYVFDFGDGSPALDQGAPLATHVFAAEGVYAVQLTVTDLANQSATVQGTFTVRDAPPGCSADADCDAGEKCGELSGCCNSSADAGCDDGGAACVQPSLCYEEIGTHGS